MNTAVNNPTAPAPPTVNPIFAITQVLLQRTPLKGSEVESYVQTYNWLEELKSGQTLVVPTPVLTALREKSEALETEIALLRSTWTPPEDELEDVDSESMISEGGPVT